MMKSGNFSIKSYVVAIYKNRLGDAILIDSNTILCYGELMVIRQQRLIVWSTVKI